MLIPNSYHPAPLARRQHRVVRATGDEGGEQVSQKVTLSDSAVAAIMRDQLGFVVEKIVPVAVTFSFSVAGW
jgi:hypothetical protein